MVNNQSFRLKEKQMQRFHIFFQCYKKLNRFKKWFKMFWVDGKKYVIWLHDILWNLHPNNFSLLKIYTWNWTSWGNLDINSTEGIFQFFSVYNVLLKVMDIDWKDG